MDNYIELREEIAALKARERGLVEVIIESDKEYRRLYGHRSSTHAVLLNMLSSNPNTKLYKAQDDVVEAIVEEIEGLNIRPLMKTEAAVATLERIEQEMK